MRSATTFARLEEDGDGPTQGQPGGPFAAVRATVGNGPSELVVRIEGRVAVSGER
jgi:hypothetical protein